MRGYVWFLLIFLPAVAVAHWLGLLPPFVYVNMGGVPTWGIIIALAVAVALLARAGRHDEPEWKFPWNRGRQR